MRRFPGPLGFVASSGQRAAAAGSGLQCAVRAVRTLAFA